MFTALDLQFRRRAEGPELTLSKIEYNISGNGRMFGVGGTYTANVPSLGNMGSYVSVTDWVEDLSVVYSNPKLTFSNYMHDYVEVSLLIIPELKYTGTSDDATITMTFHFLDADGVPYYFDNHGNPEIDFLLSSVGGGNGLLAGSRYVIKADLGTYVHFAGPPVVVYENMDENTDPEHIDI